MSIEALFPKNKQIYYNKVEKIIIIICKPKSELIINHWKTLEIVWTISDIKNSYLITNQFLHQKYLQHGNIENPLIIGQILSKNIDISKILPGKYELRLYIKFLNDKTNQIIEKYNLSSFSVKNPNIQKNTSFLKLDRECCFSNNCVILKKNN